MLYNWRPIAAATSSEGTPKAFGKYGIISVIIRSLPMEAATMVNLFALWGRGGNGGK
jgi:hypothetical protein